MADITGEIQALELRFMQSWMHRDASAIKGLAARDCMLIFGTNPPELLDRPSFTAAVEKDFRCLGFRMGESVVTRHGRAAWFTAPVELELRLGARDWQGRFLVVALWRKFRIGGWKTVERSLAPLDKDDRLAESVRRLQMWQ
ncbi:MAG: nuclear transport factor 2 family protein [Erythrobacter sp.]|uniref:nuclear transport factor 2 family protein n=1 Tax=Erythrobacter sp. TaxID=1042 RepID=UPI002635B9DD|nr:nuclear transport factor 2 family protein [Erythrobacter sp.]MDJ0977424.1 nuclear transport factor 2 family protein [Erythrobacter sp.]